MVEHVTQSMVTVPVPLDGWEHSVSSVSAFLSDADFVKRGMDLDIFTCTYMYEIMRNHSKSSVASSYETGNVERER